MDQTPIIPILILILLLIIPLLLVFLNRLRLDLAALIMAVGLGIAQLLGLGMLGPANTPADAVKAISGFSQPVVLNFDRPVHHDACPGPDRCDPLDRISINTFRRQ